MGIGFTILELFTANSELTPFFSKYTNSEFESNLEILEEKLITEFAGKDIKFMWIFKLIFLILNPKNQKGITNEKILAAVRQIKL